MSAHEYELLSAPKLQQLTERGLLTAVIPFGSIEYQGGHLPVGADALLADLVGRAVADRLDAVLIPTVRVGCAEQDRDSRGTLSVAAATLTELALAMATSLAANGFRRIVFVSIHGGNTKALHDAVGRFDDLDTDGRACAVRGDVGPRPGSHSGRWLTSVMLALRPELVELRDADEELRDELQAADAERGAEYYERFVSSMVEAARAQS